VLITDVGRLAARFVVRSCSCGARFAVVYISVEVVGGELTPENPEIPKLPNVSSVARHPPKSPDVNPLVSLSTVPREFPGDVTGQLEFAPNSSDGARNAKAATKTSKPDRGL
jgi:hypothetical protein